MTAIENQKQVLCVIFKADIEYSAWYAVTHTAARASIKQQQRSQKKGSAIVWERFLRKHGE